MPPVVVAAAAVDVSDDTGDVGLNVPAAKAAVTRPSFPPRRCRPRLALSASIAPVVHADDAAAQTCALLINLNKLISSI